MSSMMKVEEQGRGHIATRVIDAGIQNVLFADCRSTEDVRQCIRLIRPETPEESGIHGAGIWRIMLGSNPMEWVQAMNDAVIAIMIEKKRRHEKSRRNTVCQRHRYGPIRTS